MVSFFEAPGILLIAAMVSASTARAEVPNVGTFGHDIA